MTYTFGRISELNPLDSTTWENILFLTFDIDWACDEVLAETIDLVEQADVAATWFVTHDTPLLARLRVNPKFELGIHPNFNLLLEGDTRNGKNPSEIVDRLLKIIPGAKSVRTHALLQSSRLLQLFCDLGLTHDCNHFIPEQAGITLKPWILWNGLIKVPHLWEDDAAYIYKHNAPMKYVMSRAGLKVFDFHPIHVFLNTECSERYERTRESHHDPATLSLQRFDGNGTRTALKALLGVSD
jgi:hypothetical protein